MSNRKNRRHPSERDKSIYSNELNSLPPSQRRLVQKLANEISDNSLKGIAKVINQSYYQAMRNNRISEDRARKILEQTELLIKLEGEIRG